MFVTRSPEESVSRHDASRAYGGYTLFAPHASTDVWLIDMEGRVVHRWKMPSRVGSGIELLPNGNQLRLNKTGNEPTAFLGSGGGELVEVDWQGKVVWKHEDPYMHHDFKRLDNGNTVLNRHVLIPEEIARRVKGGIPGTEHESGMWGNAYREITPGGDIVWEWLGYEHMDPETDVPCPLCPRSIWGYVNGIDVLPNGDVIGSFRHLNNLMVVDRTTGAVKWRWGTWELGHQHNPTMLAGGNVLVLDNGYHRMPPYDMRTTVSAEGYSRVLEVSMATGEIEWEYLANPPTSFWSHVCSSAQRLPNGNTLVCESSSGRIFEITAEGDVVWEFTSPFYERIDRYGLTNLVYKARRYSFDYEGLRGKTLAPLKYDWAIGEHVAAIGEPIA